MKRQRWIPFAAALLVLVFTTAVMVIAAEQKIPDVITLQFDIWKTHKKPLVEFPHKQHIDKYGLKCQECHHIYKDGKNVWKEGDPVRKCDECHNEPTKKLRKIKKLTPEPGYDLLKDKRGHVLLWRNLYSAVHTNCLGCHRQYKKEHPESKPPISCSKCHKRKK